jgi:hypothetical protein
MAFQSRRRGAGHWPVGTDLVAKAPPDGDTMLLRKAGIERLIVTTGETPGKKEVLLDDMIPDEMITNPMIVLIVVIVKDIRMFSNFILADK